MPNLPQPNRSKAFQLMTMLGGMPTRTTGASPTIYPESRVSYDPDSRLGTAAGSFNSADNWSQDPYGDLMAEQYPQLRSAMLDRSKPYPGYLGNYITGNVPGVRMPRGMAPR